jgi:hypothetical protein
MLTNFIFFPEYERTVKFISMAPTKEEQFFMFSLQDFFSKPSRREEWGNLNFRHYFNKMDV